MTFRKSRGLYDSPAMLPSRRMLRSTPSGDDSFLWQAPRRESVRTSTLLRKFIDKKVSRCFGDRLKRRLPFFVTLILGIAVFAFFQYSSVNTRLSPRRGNVSRTSRKFGRIKNALSYETRKEGSIHIAMIFDEKRQNFSRTVMRSISFYSTYRVVYHLIAPLHLHENILEDTDDLLGEKKIIVYDYSQCFDHIRKVWFISKMIHSSAFCKMFLSHIIPSSKQILYLDSDITVLQDLSSCWFNTVRMSPSQYIGMAVDMGGICQLDPDHCYPMGFEWVIPPGLQCGTVPYRAAQNLAADPNHPCRRPGEREPYQFNGGVMLMDLGKMRTQNFTNNFVRASISTWRKLKFKKARWGEQDLINNFFRLYPETLYELDCGCNYQYSASRREVKCPGKPVVIAHGWTRQLLDDRSPDLNNGHFHFFRFNVPNEHSLPPQPPLVSLISKDWNNVSSSPKTRTPLCDHQLHDCSLKDRPESEGLALRLNDRVNVLTRTAKRPVFFSENAASVREQTHADIKHFVVTDDPDSMLYLQNTSAELIPSLYDQFDPKEVCKRCKGPDLIQCARAPPPSDMKARQEFFNCYCSTGYPMNAYISSLHARASRGWIVYLDDDNLFVDKFAVSEMLAHATSRDELLAFRSILGRQTPLEINFGKRIVMGDFDASNFAFHTTYRKFATWGTKRCGDYRAAASLARHLDVKWISSAFIQSHPLRAPLGGLGRRGESLVSRLTVVITSFNVGGWRPHWLEKTIETYLSASYDAIVAKVILVWNNVDKPPPTFEFAHTSKFLLIRAKRNSLNNRWVDTLQYIETESILNLDDDLYISKAGIICMMNWQAKDPFRMVSPFVRRIEKNGTYVLDELKDSSAYTMVLPRAVLLSRYYLELYRAQEYSQLRAYVDSQDAHCDDIVLNVIAFKNTGNAPLRVVLPRGTLVDFYTLCWTKDHEMVGGLGLQVDRISKRNECVKYIMEKAGVENMKATKPMGVCLPKGNALMKVEYATPPRFDAMIDFDLSCTEDRH